MKTALQDFQGENYMLKFLRDRKHMQFGDQLSYCDLERPHLRISHPAILASFIGYIKFQVRKADPDMDVFFRGQTKDSDSIIPSLLRGADLDKINKLSEANAALISKIPQIYKSLRFKKEVIDNMLQHYGLKSKTLDLVDNIYIAVWFATHEWRKIDDSANRCSYAPSKQDFGWIHFLKARSNYNVQLKREANFEGHCDLRKYHSSLSTRMHCQHGITYIRNAGTWTEQNRCFDNLLVATVRFPNSDSFRMAGDMLSTKFLFPGPDVDNTYKLLLYKKFATLQSSVEDNFKLYDCELGRIWRYEYT